jgi:hypothetical protein
MKEKPQELLRHLQYRMTHGRIRDYLLHHKATQVYICIDSKRMNVTVNGKISNSLTNIATFYRAPSLAEAVVAAHNFCDRYYRGVPTLEYNVW